MSEIPADVMKTATQVICQKRRQFFEISSLREIARLTQKRLQLLLNPTREQTAGQLQLVSHHSQRRSYYSLAAYQFAEIIEIGFPSRARSLTLARGHSAA